MLGKTSVSMMVLLVVAASLIGISSIYQYVDWQGPRATKLPQQLSAVGTVASVRMIDSPAGKACAAALSITQTVSPVHQYPSSQGNSNCSWSIHSGISVSTISANSLL